ncbi:MAG: hypothetical protein ACRDAM_01400 [Casimicrobium sp.]
MFARVGHLAFLASLIAIVGCETIPQLQSPVAGVSTARPPLKVVVDQRSDLAKSSTVERSGNNPIVLLGDERFDMRPIDRLDQVLASEFAVTADVVVRKFDVRYIQGGNLDAMTYGLTLGVSGAGAILGTVLYGAMAGHARGKNPSKIEINAEGTLRGNEFSFQHEDLLGSGNESHELRRVIDEAARKLALKLSTTTPGGNKSVE